MTTPPKRASEMRVKIRIRVKAFGMKNSLAFMGGRMRELVIDPKLIVFSS